MHNELLPYIYPINNNIKIEALMNMSLLSDIFGYN